MSVAFVQSKPILSSPLYLSAFLPDRALKWGGRLSRSVGRVGRPSFSRKLRFPSDLILSPVKPTVDSDYRWGREGTLLWKTYSPTLNEARDTNTYLHVQANLDF